MTEPNHTTQENYLNRVFGSSAFTRDFKLICLYQIILNIMDGMMGLFLPIFLFGQFNQNIYWVIIFYLVGYGLYGLLVPLGAMAMSKIGLKRSMIFARFISVFFYLSLFYFKNNIILFSILANLALLIFRLFYWVPYNTNFAQITHRDQRGRQVAYIALVGYLSGMIAPLLAGLILDRYGFNILFIITISSIIFSIIPLMFLKPVQAIFQFSYFGTFKEWLKKTNRNLRTAFMADGAQDLIGIVVWPIFIYQLLERQYLAVGAASALIIIGTITCYLIIGQYADKIEKKRLIRLGSLFYALGWFLKTFVATAFQIFIVGTIHSFSNIIMHTPFDALTYERAADHGSYIDEYTVLRDVSINLGRVLMGVFLIALIYAFGLRIAFPLAAVISLLVNML